MRIRLAKLLAAATGLVIVLLAAAFAAIRNAPTDSAVAVQVRIGPQGAQPSDVERGRAVYEAQRCRRCHSIGGEGNARYPLDGVGTRLTDREVRTWIVSPQEMNPRVAKRGYELSGADLDALVAYLRASVTK